MLTPLSSRLVYSSLSFITLGILLGNLLLVYTGLLPLLVLFSGLLFSAPSNPLDLEFNTKETHNVGDIIKIKRKIQIEEGMGLIILGEEIPKLFEVVQGNNIKLIWKGLSPLTTEFCYSIRGTKRGIYDLTKCNWELKHSLGLTATKLGTSPINQSLIIQTYPLQVRKIRQQKVFSNIPMPSDAQVRLGIPTTDFKEIKEYAHGDPFKNINWKATSRRGHLSKPPMVNQYEMEGMKIVWLYLNTSREMAIGSSISNSLEYGVQAIMGLSQFYLGRNCRIGVTLYDDDKSYRIFTKRANKYGVFSSRRSFIPNLMMWDRLNYDTAPETTEKIEAPGDFIIPDLGKKQLYTVSRKMLETELSRGKYNLKQSVINSRGHIIGRNPLFYIVTNITKSNLKRLEDGINELMRYTTASRHRGSPIIIVHIKGYMVKATNEAEKFAANILEIDNQKYIRKLRRKGIMVVEWDPTKHRFAQVLLSQVRKR